MKKEFLLLVIFFTACNTAFTQSKIVVTGSIIGDELLKPLPFAYIIVGSKGTTSNMNGKFSVEVNALDTIRFSYVGFENKLIVVPNNLTNNTFEVKILMLKNITFLKNITVTSLPATIKAFKEEIFEIKFSEDENLEYAQKSIDLATYQSLYMSSFKLNMTAYDNYSMFMKGYEGLNPRAGNVKGLLKFLKYRADGIPLEGTYGHYKYYQNNKGR